MKSDFFAGVAKTNITTACREHVTDDLFGKVLVLRQGKTSVMIVSLDAVAIGGICGLRILWIAFVVPLSPSLRTLMISYPVSWGITLAVDLVIFLVLFRKRKREIERSSPPV